MFKLFERRVVTAPLVEVAVGLIALFALLLAPAAHADEDFLDPAAAFRFSARMLDAKTAEVSYAIADGYYMYRERFAFKADDATLGAPVFPPGKVKFDDTFQKNVETYHGSVMIRLPVTAAGPFTLAVTGQGCADKGLCYAPMTTQVKLSPNGGGLLAVLGMQTPHGTSASVADSSLVTANSMGNQDDSATGRIEASLKGGKLLVILPLFLVLGLGLSFTPCVLPMLPILSAIIVGEGVHVSRARGFALALAYSIGMALVYTCLGIAAGLAGEGLSASLQNPWMLGGFALLMVVLALSMLGAYQIQMPAAIQTRLATASGRQSTGKLFGVFVMGAISALIVGPCVAAPLVGALLYISQTRDVVIGGGALFAMATGMSVPLLLLGISAGALLPRAGVWMQTVKIFFGVLMLGLALWIVTPVLPEWAPMTGWAALGLGYGSYLLWEARSGWSARAVGLLFAVLGLLQVIGVATGGRDALAPLAHLTGAVAKKTEFHRVRSVAELDAAIANANGKTVMLDFYADWCVSCKEMEKLTFSDSRVQSRFAGMLLLQADVTANNDNDKALLKRFNLFGPPGIIFFNQQGKEIRNRRVIGYQDAEKFLGSLAVVNRF